MNEHHNDIALYLPAFRFASLVKTTFILQINHFILKLPIGKAVIRHRPNIFGLFYYFRTLQ
jgi:hypothetical protein